MDTYAAQIPRKYSGVVERTKDEADEKEQVYSTNEGDVLISLSGTGVFVAEGFDLALARKLRNTIVSVQAGGPMKQAAVQEREPGLSMGRALACLGAVNADAAPRDAS